MVTWRTATLRVVSKRASNLLFVCVLPAALVVAACGAVPTALSSPSSAASPTGVSSAAPSVSPTLTFISPVYGYTVKLPAWWMPSAATSTADPVSNEPNPSDLIPIPGTDTTIEILGWALGDETYADWAKAYHDDVITHVPSGCDGGDPSTWPQIQVGTTQGYWLQKCNAAEAIVPIGKRVFVFTWGHDTFDSSRHMPISDFKSFLLGVTLPEAAIDELPFWVPSPSP